MHTFIHEYMHLHIQNHASIHTYTHRNVSINTDIVLPIARSRKEISFATFRYETRPRIELPGLQHYPPTHTHRIINNKFETNWRTTRILSPFPPTNTQTKTDWQKPKSKQNEQSTKQNKKKMKMKKAKWHV